MNTQRILFLIASGLFFLAFIFSLLSESTETWQSALTAGTALIFALAAWRVRPDNKDEKQSADQRSPKA